MTLLKKCLFCLFLIAVFPLLGTAVYATDTDGDNVSDRIDVDDDNDGILDTNEGLSAIDQWVTDGSTQESGTVENALLTVGSNTSSIAVFPVMGASFRSNSSSNTVVFIAEGQSANGTFNVTFTEPLYEFQLFLGSLYRERTRDALFGNFTLKLTDGTVIPDADFTIINEDDGFFSFGAVHDLETILVGGKSFVRSSQVSTSGSLNQGRGLLEFSALKSGVGLSAISFDQESTITQNFTATLGFNGAFASDFDNDHIANYGDLDSDNDGIADNIEAQTTLNYLPPQ